MRAAEWIVAAIVSTSALFSGCWLVTPFDFPAPSEASVTMKAHEIGATSAFCTGGGCESLTVSYSPVTGNSVLVFLSFDLAHPVSNVSVRDSSDHALTLDETYSGMYCQDQFRCMQVWRQAVVPSEAGGVTQYSASWTSNTNAGAIVVEYAGLGGPDPGVFRDNSNGYDTASWTTGTSGKLTSPNDLLFCLAVDGRDSSQGWTPDLNSPFETILDADDPGSGAGAMHLAQWVSPGSTSGETCNGTVTKTGSEQVVAAIGGYLPAD
jgi:hypothetical protein